jgi:hypothetical protein
MPNYAYPPDPKSKDPWYKEITTRCEPFTKKFLEKASELFGPPSKPADMPVRVTEFSEGPRTCFHNGIAYIRIQHGVSKNPDEHELQAQLAHEMVHVLLKTMRNTVLEEGLGAYFAVNYADAHPPHASDPNERKYYGAYEAVTKLMEKDADIIQKLRKPARPFDKIAAAEIHELCPDYPGDFDHLASDY